MKNDMRVFYHPEGRLRLEFEGKCYLSVVPIWASPLTHPSRFLALVDGKGSQILMFKNPSQELSAENWQVLQTELQRRYLSSQIHKVLEAKTEFGATYWTVVTDRGCKEFVTQSLQENAQWLGPDHLLVIDVDGNRFEIRSVQGLDEASRKLVDATV
ncbi:MAG: DUF1854 domain-containing protein [Fimbriimonadaceae bacterium]|jgi:hypothetical protein|nr:DUF1854 domain-containing protein [Fimbriimonadaceae bacterium]